MQIGDENVYRVRALMDEVFGDENFMSELYVTKTGSQTGSFLGNVTDIVIWYGRDKVKSKYRSLYFDREFRQDDDFSPDPILSGGNSKGAPELFHFKGEQFSTGLNSHWKTNLSGMARLAKADRIEKLKTSIRYKRFFNDYPVKALSNVWTDLGGAVDVPTSFKQPRGW